MRKDEFPIIDKLLEQTINRFNLLCEIEMNAHEPYKATRPLNLERLHRVRDKMLEQLKEQNNGK